MTVASALADIRGMTDAGYRTEVLCQWVTSHRRFVHRREGLEGLHVPASDVAIPLGRARCGASTPRRPVADVDRRGGDSRRTGSRS
jgi:hypothetical protein